ncbi:hypothetical protein Nepgr_027844 [Nepenthes gracilis]|uniref:Fe2OG dioxygenase domain-containing protein n=1 Tax=Nepenthes gracilis TaxID=150966 RepID=A0AAD3TC37_NEPGR|nr:hypothetical protein Nepgr_027844 [Nepenthes gracilis]
MEELTKKLLRDVFGESSDSDEGDQSELPLYQSVPEVASSVSISCKSTSWERIEEVNGLWLCKDFLSPQQQLSLLSAIGNEGWFTDASHNQAMRFGDLPSWAIELSNSICEMASAGNYDSETGDFATVNHNDAACVLPSHLLWRKPLFDQLIVNLYQPGEGICAHVDLLRFEDGIAIVSLESSCVMHFSRVEENEGEVLPTSKLPVYLNPGSLVIMWGDARYLWKHEINRSRGCQVCEGKEIDQKKRTSITLRKLRHTK